MNTRVQELASILSRAPFPFFGIAALPLHPPLPPPRARIPEHSIPCFPCLQCPRNHAVDGSRNKFRAQFAGVGRPAVGPAISPARAIPAPPLRNFQLYAREPQKWFIRKDNRRKTNRKRTGFKPDSDGKQAPWPTQDALAPPSAKLQASHRMAVRRQIKRGGQTRARPPQPQQTKAVIRNARTRETPGEPRNPDPQAQEAKALIAKHPETAPKSEPKRLLSAFITFISGPVTLAQLL
jgi:hypothetical protein